MPPVDRFSEDVKTCVFKSNCNGQKAVLPLEGKTTTQLFHPCTWENAAAVSNNLLRLGMKCGGEHSR